MNVADKDIDRNVFFILLRKRGNFCDFLFLAEKCNFSKTVMVKFDIFRYFLYYTFPMRFLRQRISL